MPLRLVPLALLLGTSSAGLELKCRGSITTRAMSDGFIASVRVATARLSCNSALSLSAPVRWRQRVSDDLELGSMHEMAELVVLGQP
jgi:hypothetical protein